jgi:hypothetical protein
MWPGTNILVPITQMIVEESKVSLNILTLIFEHPTHGLNNYKDTKP